MKLWGNSDANNAKRLSLLNRAARTPDLGSRFCVMHLEHNSPLMPKGGPVPKNSWKEWIDDVATPLSHNPENWGLRDIELPPITLEKFGTLSPDAIYGAVKRDRSMTRLTTALKIRLWRTASPWLQRLKRKIDAPK